MQNISTKWGRWQYDFWYCYCLWIYCLWSYCLWITVLTLQFWSVSKAVARRDRITGRWLQGISTYMLTMLIIDIIILYYNNWNYKISAQTWSLYGDGYKLKFLLKDNFRWVMGVGWLMIYDWWFMIDRSLWEWQVVVTHCMVRIWLANERPGIYT